MIVQSGKLLGWVFLAVGILGFIPGVAPGGHLLGIFMVNGAHNVVHLLTGGVLLWAAYKSECTCMHTFQVIGIVYALVSLVGLFAYDATMIGPVAMNFADTLLHMVFALFALYCGFLEKYRHPVHCPTRA